MEDNTKTSSPSDNAHSTHILLRSAITPEIMERLGSFFELMPPHAFRDHLIELYHNYILHEHDTLPYDFRELAEGMIIFLDFLKYAGEELDAYHVTHAAAPLEK